MAALPASAPAQWLSQLAPFAQAVAFARLLGVILLLLAAMAGLARFLRVPAVIAALAGAVFVVFPVTVPWSPGPDTAPGGDRELSLITFNTMGTLTADELVFLLDRHDPDVLILLETTEEQLIAAAKGEENYTTRADGDTAMLLHHRVGEVTAAAGPDVSRGSLAVRLPGGPVVAGAHTTAPVPGSMGAWRDDLDELDAWVDGSESVILAGDLNATLRHGPLADRDRLATARCGGQGTWPAGVPGWISTRIDHVLAGPDVAVTDCGITRVGDSDHRAVAARLEY